MAYARLPEATGRPGPAGALGGVDVEAALNTGVSAGEQNVRDDIESGKWPDPGQAVEAGVDVTVRVVADTYCQAYGAPPGICAAIADEVWDGFKKEVIGPVAEFFAGLFRAEPESSLIRASLSTQVAMLNSAGDSILSYEVGRLQSLHYKLGLPGPYCFGDVVKRLKDSGLELRRATASHSTFKPGGRPLAETQDSQLCGTIRTQYLAPLFGVEFMQKVGLISCPAGIAQANCINKQKARIAGFRKSRLYVWNGTLAKAAAIEVGRLVVVAAAFRAQGLVGRTFPGGPPRLKVSGTGWWTAADVEGYRRRLKTPAERTMFLRCIAQQMKSTGQTDRVSDKRGARCYDEARAAALRLKRAAPTRPPPTILYGTTPHERMRIEICGARAGARPSVNDWKRCRAAVLAETRKKAGAAWVPVLLGVGGAAAVWALIRRR